MMPGIPRLMLAGLVVVGMTAWNGTVRAAAGDLAKGKAHYEQFCVACHWAQGKGDGPAGKTLKPPAADFTSAASKKKSGADLRKTIEEGKPGTAMTPWKGPLSPTDITDVLAYLESFRK